MSSSTRNKAVDFGAGNVDRYFASATVDVVPSTPYSLVVCAKATNATGSEERIFWAGGSRIIKEPTTGEYRFESFTGIQGDSSAAIDGTHDDGLWRIFVGSRNASNEVRLRIVPMGSATAVTGNLNTHFGGGSDTQAILGSASLPYTATTAWGLYVHSEVTEDQAIALANHADPQSLARIHGWDLRGLWYANTTTATLEDLSGNGNDLAPNGSNWPAVVDAPVAGDFSTSYSSQDTGNYRYRNNSGAIINLPNDTARGRTVIALLRVNTFSGFETLFSTQVYNLNECPTIRLNATGSILLGKWNSGGGDASVSVTPGTWYVIRLRNINGTLSLHTWEPGQSSQHGFGSTTGQSTNAISGNDKVCKRKINDQYTYIK